MTRALIPLCLLAALPVAMAQQAAIPPSVDAAFERYTHLPGLLVPILESATDKASADAAADKLFAALPALYEARSGLEEIARLSPAETAQVEKKFGLKMRREWGKVFEQIYRLQRAQCYGSLPFVKQFQTMCMMLEK